MKPLYLVANWKSNKTPAQALDWLQNVKCQMSNPPAGRAGFKLNDRMKIILCAPFTVLVPLKEEIIKESLPIHLGAQDISPFGTGAYTGEISADMLKGLIEYVLVGHSERRKYFHEEKEELRFEILQAHSVNFQVIYCIDGENAYIPASVDIIAYEPVWAIGSGKVENPELAGIVCKKLKQKNHQKPVLYGGSVTEKNIREFLLYPAIDGVLVGGSSLDPEQFISLVKAMSSYE